jgi:hypothetical protein
MGMTVPTCDSSELYTVNGLVAKHVNFISIKLAYKNLQ